MLTSSDRALLKDDIEYQTVVAKGEERQITFSEKKYISGSIIQDSARTQDEKGGVNIKLIMSLITNNELPINTRVNVKGNKEIYKIEVCYKKATRLSGLYYYQITRV